MKKKMKKSKKVVIKKTTRPTSTSSTNKSGITPLGDRVLVRPLSPDEIENKVTSFGIIIPDTAKEKPEQGTVVAVGPGRRTDKGEVIPVAVKAGDRVMFAKYGFEEVKIDGVEYYIVSEKDILAVLEK
jgi:chaperonin GroES